LSTFALLRRPAFGRLVAGRTVSAFGSAFATVALAFAVLDQTGSAIGLGLVVGARTLTNVVLLLFGGVLADRLPRHLLMVGAAVAACLSQAAVAALILSHAATVVLLALLAAVNGGVSAVSLPASSALLPQTVRADERRQANAINRLLLNGSQIVGAPVGGLVVAAVGPGWAIAIDASTFGVAALCYAMVRIAPQAAPAPGPAANRDLLLDLRTGWTEFRSRSWLWTVVAGACVINACLGGGLNILGPVVADATFGRQAWGFVLAAQTAGMIVGGLVAMRIRVHRLLLLGTASTAALALPVIGLGAWPEAWLLVLLSFTAGVGLEQFAVAWETTLQEHVPGDKLARVYSYDMVGSLLATPLGQVTAGPLAALVGTGTALLGAGALTLASVLAMTANPEVRRLRHRYSSAGTAPSLGPSA
jgi:MFS family permease